MIPKITVLEVVKNSVASQIGDVNKNERKIASAKNEMKVINIRKGKTMRIRIPG